MSPLLRRTRTPPPEPADPAAEGRDGEAPTAVQDAPGEPVEPATAAYAAPAGGDGAGLGTAEPEPAARLADGPAPAEPEPGLPPRPAGLAPEDEIGERPDTRRRGRLRRRLRHLRRVRELMLRDVGGLVYELHRAGAQPAAAGDPHGSELVRGKLERLAGLDAERRQLEEVLGDRRATTVLREPGVGGTCPSCGEYFASDARFCAHCGDRVDGRGALAEPQPVAVTAPQGAPATEPEADREPGA